MSEGFTLLRRKCTCDKAPLKGLLWKSDVEDVFLNSLFSDNGKMHWREKGL